MAAITTCSISANNTTITFGNGTNDMCVPENIEPGWNALDSSKTGRNNSTGDMFRDKVADKRKWTVSLPYGLTNTQVAQILSIISQPQYTFNVPDALTGTKTNFTCYTTSCEPKIALMTSESGWIYEAFSFNAIEF